MNLCRQNGSASIEEIVYNFQKTGKEIYYTQIRKEARLKLRDSPKMSEIIPSC